ncbi:MAG: hypothetical protein K8L91_08560 [Anaerolineae bacterium]|nr:hypothetical protein [Anaerolineae bacterium]
MKSNKFRWSRDLTAWFIICLAVGIVSLLYLSLGLAASNGPLLMPLDDTYIHFQYARQMASGEPYVYSPGDHPTSGATSFLYTPLLAVGYFIGFHGLYLAYWAVAIGSLSFLLSAWLIFRLMMESPVAKRPLDPLFEQGGEHQAMWWIALLITLAYIVTGAMVWAAVSGMETMLFLLAVLLSLYTYQRSNPKHMAWAGAFAALTRPEGAIIALSLTLILLYRSRRAKQFHWLDFLPFFAIYVQPLVNFAMTGSVSASGNQAKSILYDVTIPMDERIGKVIGQWVRMLGELVFGASEVDGVYITIIVAFLAMLAIFVSLRTSLSKKELRPTVLAFIWIMLLSAAIATLDTAFWHFKRYQLPMMALLFPLVGSMLFGFISIGVVNRRWMITIAAIILFFQANTTLDFAGRYHDNIGVVHDQQLAMARWVNQNLPKEARVGVHDVGMIAYIGNRKVYDVVGLTTPDAAEAWWQGPGAIYETMAHHPYRPNYFAIYPDVRGLPMLQEAGVFGEELARFEIDLPQHTVASATGTQIVTKADWSLTNAEDVVHQPSILPYLEGYELFQVIDVGNLESEAKADYEVKDNETSGGFATDVRHLSYLNCSENCDVIDGGRIITGGEKFTINDQGTNTNAYLIILRVHASEPASLILDVDCFGCSLEDVVVPNIPGHWVDIPFLIGNRLGTQSTISIDARYGTRYYAYSYFIFRHIGEKNLSETTNETNPVAIFGIPMIDAFSANGTPAVWPVCEDRVSCYENLELSAVSFENANKSVQVNLDWYLPLSENLSRDGKIFVHLYDDPNQPPIKQIDVWPGGSLPPANWLPGYRSDAVTLPLDDVPPGTYSLAIGIYDPNTNERYTVIDQRTAESSDRLFLGEVVIGND